MNYKLSIAQLLFGHQTMWTHISDLNIFFSLSRSLHSHHYSSPFHRRPTTKTLNAPEVEQAKLLVTLCLKYQPSSTRIQAREGRRSSRLRYYFLTITHRSLILFSQGGHLWEALSILFPVISILLGGSCQKIYWYTCNPKLWGVFSAN